jgi:hypothetical protein
LKLDAGLRLCFFYGKISTWWNGIRFYGIKNDFCRPTEIKSPSTGIIFVPTWIKTESTGIIFAPTGIKTEFPLAKHIQRRKSRYMLQFPTNKSLKVSKTPEKCPEFGQLPLTIRYFSCIKHWHDSCFI